MEHARIKASTAMGAAACTDVPPQGVPTFLDSCKCWSLGQLCQKSFLPFHLLRLSHLAPAYHAYTNNCKLTDCTAGWELSSVRGGCVALVNGGLYTLQLESGHVSFMIDVCCTLILFCNQKRDAN